MNNILAFLIMFGIATVLCATADAAEVQRFNLGSAEIWAIADSTGDRDMGVFEADPALVTQYAPTGKSPSGVLTFVVKTADRTILIDTGHGNAASQLVPGLLRAGFNPDEVDTVLITHMHGDHIGGLFRDGGAAFPNAKVLIGDVEFKFWTSEISRNEFPDRKANFDMAHRVKDTYGKAIGVFEFGDVVAPGITALDSRGHTPGHTVFMLEFGGEKLMCIGDLVHAAALQFPHPEINARYDMVPDQAKAARAKYLEMSASQDVPVAGMHLPFPGIGKAERKGAAYTYRPGM